MDKKLSNFLEKREHTVLTDIDVITAAVAVPLLEIDGEDHVVFTVRSNKLRRQPGEISFPGGHCEPNDKSGAHAAIRECSEELGINLDQIELLGNLDCLVSAIGVKLYAVAVRLHTIDLKPNPDEVGEVFTVTFTISAKYGTYRRSSRHRYKTIKGLSILSIRRLQYRLEN